MSYVFSKENCSYISGNGNPERETLKKLLIFQEVTCKARKTNKKSALKTFLVSYDVFAIFTSVEHIEVPLEAKKKTKKHRYNVINNLKACSVNKLCNKINF